MMKILSRLLRPHYRHWPSFVVTFVTALLLCVGYPKVTQALSLGDLIFRGIQILQLSNISDRQEVEIGQRINEQLVRSQVKLYRDPALERYVNRIGRRLAAQSTRPQLPYRFQIVNDKGVNAFATLGGFVYLHTGLLTAADNEAQLASVIAHEIGHIEGRHFIEQLRQNAIASGVAEAAGVDQNALAQIGVELALRRPRSRKDEYEADELGLRSLGRAGYAQSAMVAFMEKLLRSRSVPTFLSTHPATDNRIDRLRENLNPKTANTGDGLNEAAYETRIRRLRS